MNSRHGSHWLRLRTANPAGTSEATFASGEPAGSLAGFNCPQQLVD
ncbi:MAG: hypothetical protein ABSE97_06310 [Verrucomicrobiota bacterium]|jgi:hypothetical protein